MKETAKVLLEFCFQEIYIPLTSNSFVQIPLGFFLVASAQRLIVRSMQEAVVIQR